MLLLKVLILKNTITINTMKIKITKSSNNRSWYDNRIGETFHVRRIESDSYWLKPNPDDPYSGWNFVPFEHCEIYKEEN